MSIRPELTAIDGKKFPFFVIYGKFWRKTSKHQPRAFSGLGSHSQKIERSKENHKVKCKSDSVGQFLPSIQLTMRKADVDRSE